MRIVLVFLMIFSTEVFSQSWQVVGQMPVPVSGAQAIVHDSLIYILGGFSESQNSNINLIQEYNPETNTWKVAGTMNSPRADFIAGTYSDSIIYAGGISSELPESSSLEFWGYTNSAFVTAGNEYFNRLYSTGKVIGDNIYVFGGSAKDSTYPYMFVYNLSTNKITFSNDTLFTNSFPTLQMSAVYNNYIYLFGGARDVLQKSIYKFDISNNKITQLSVEMEHPRAGGAAVFLNNKIYIIGGFDEYNKPLYTTKYIRVYSGGESEMEDGPSLIFARKDPVAVNYYGNIYVFGGLGSDGQDVSYIEMFNNISTTIINDKSSAPLKFNLGNNYPNPFNPSTQIRFEVPKQSRISVDIFSILGKHIKNLTSKIYDPGNYNITWDGTNMKGEQVSSGIYIYRLSSIYFSESKKMILLK
jgi:hypothetical protein